MFRRLNSYLQVWTLFLIVLGNFSSCTCKKQKDEATEPAASVTTSTTASTNRTTANSGQLSKTIMRLTPEQISNHIHQSLEYRLGWNDEQGRFFDVITKLIAVPLGGVDFQTASVRDSDPKIQTLLLVRTIAWQVASAVVWREVKPDASEFPLFTKCNLKTDRPYLPEDNSKNQAQKSEIEAGELRWREQLNDFYWRLFGRAPTTEEVTAVRDSWVEVYRIQQWPPSAWTVVLYAWLSTAEFWNI